MKVQQTGFRCLPGPLGTLMLIVLFVGVFVTAAIPSYLAPLRHGVAWPFALGQAVLSGLVADLVMLVILVAAVKIFVKVTGLPPPIPMADLTRVGEFWDKFELAGNAVYYEQRKIITYCDRQDRIVVMQLPDFEEDRRYASGQAIRGDRRLLNELRDLLESRTVPQIQFDEARLKPPK